jgi:hypothetical protein
VSVDDTTRETGTYCAECGTDLPICPDCGKRFCDEDCREHHSGLGACPDVETHEGSGIHCQHRKPLDISELQDGGIRRHLHCSCGADWFEAVNRST